MKKINKRADEKWKIDRRNRLRCDRVTSEKRTDEQRLSIDVEFATDILAPARTDSLKTRWIFQGRRAGDEICRSAISIY